MARFYGLGFSVSGLKDQPLRIQGYGIEAFGISSIHLEMRSDERPQVKGL